MLEQIAKKNNIVTNEDIKDRIAYLEVIRDEQEEVIKMNLVEVHKSLQPMELIKTAIDKVRDDAEIHEKAGGLIGTLGINYVMGKVFRNKKNTIGGYVKGILIQQAASFLYKKNEKKINGFITNLTRKAMRKIHALEDEEPLDRIEAAKKRADEIEEEEDRQLNEAKTAELREAKEKPLYQKDDPRVKVAIDPQKVEDKKQELEEEEEG